MVCLISCSKFSDVLPAFICARAIGQYQRPPFCWGGQLSVPTFEKGGDIRKK